MRENISSYVIIIYMFMAQYRINKFSHLHLLSSRRQTVLVVLQLTHVEVGRPAGRLHELRQFGLHLIGRLLQCLHDWQLGPELLDDFLITKKRGSARNVNSVLY